jgi:hypothetical protein
VKNQWQKNLFSWTLLTAILFGASTAQAYRYKICLDRVLKWESPNVNYQVSSVSFATEAWQNGADAAFSLWNQNPSQFRFDHFFAAGVKRDNGENEMWFTNDDAVLSGAPARALSWYDCIDYWIFGKTVKIKEVDIVFDSRVAYTPSMGSRSSLLSYGGTLRPFWTTAIHEMGHTLGLAHVNTRYNVLGEDWTHIHANGPTARAYAGEDASNGAIFLYGPGSPAIQDLSVTHFKYSGANGEYSTHVRTQLFDASNVEVPFVMVKGEKVYQVDLGQTVRMEMTFENNGLDPQDALVGYYLSTNDIITTLDRKIGAVGMHLSRDNVFTYTHALTIPRDLVHGRNYWLGAVIDEDDKVSEITEQNNATFMSIRVK